MQTRFSLMLLATLLASLVNAQQKATHPLDPLTAAEIRKVVEILKKTNTISGKELFNVINLKEPPKQEVLLYQDGQPFRREAFASYFDFARKGVSEAVIDLNKEREIGRASCRERV